jgi:hypothetical protein
MTIDLFLFRSMDFMFVHLKFSVPRVVLGSLDHAVLVLDFQKGRDSFPLATQTTPPQLVISVFQSKWA